MRRLLLLAGLAAPSAAWACATCFDPKDASQSAFLLPTIAMSLLPLAMMGAIVGWLWRATRRAADGAGAPAAVLTPPFLRGPRSPAR